MKRFRDPERYKSRRDIALTHTTGGQNIQFSPPLIKGKRVKK
jgi:hypothetical protein